MKELLERRSIRKYDPSVKISKEEMTQMLAKATRAPSSMNMQSWRFFIVQSEEAKEKLRPVLYGNQLQLDTSSAMICIFTDLEKFQNAEKIFEQAIKENIMPVDVKERQLRSIANMVDNLTEISIEKTGWLDAGLVAMQLMHVARSHGYDTCSIGGFKHDLIAEALSIDKKRYKPVMILSIGKKDEDGHKSVRLDPKDITTWL
ncbi:MAG: nitroreductase family protein [Acholeplasmataceae bacterium]|nr:nitroreductase family protein [Acholeplasmataceae bacterium]